MRVVPYFQAHNLNHNKVILKVPKSQLFGILNKLKDKMNSIGIYLIKKVHKSFQEVGSNNKNKERLILMK
jgi:hypothetical protein